MLIFGYSLLAFMHIHFESGERIEVHSHPYQGEDKGETHHSHSNTDKIYLAHLSKLFQLISILILAVLIGTLKPVSIFATIINIHVDLGYYSRKIGRAPPAPASLLVDD